MRVLTHKTTGRILEAQSGGDESQLEILFQNAESAGIDRTDCVATVMPDDEFSALLREQMDGDKTYADRRREEYPSIGDQLDALYHAGAFPEDMAEQIAAVKAKYPKP